MKKADFLALANIGVIEVEKVKLEVEIKPDADGLDFIKIKMHPITPLHDLTFLGRKWLKYTDESEFLTFESEIKKHKEQAQEFYNKAQRIVKATMTKKGIKILDLPESVQKDWDFYENAEEKERAIKRFIKEPHKMVYIDKDEKTFYALGCFSLHLDGVLYVPRWSYWQARPYYEVKAV